jgi:hypothetical protein
MCPDASAATPEESIDGTSCMLRITVRAPLSNARRIAFRKLASSPDTSGPCRSRIVTVSSMRVLIMTAGTWREPYHGVQAAKRPADFQRPLHLHVVEGGFTLSFLAQPEDLASSAMEVVDVGFEGHQRLRALRIQRPVEESDAEGAGTGDSRRVEGTIRGEFRHFRVGAEEGRNLVAQRGAEPRLDLFLEGGQVPGSRREDDVAAGDKGLHVL